MSVGAGAGWVWWGSGGTAWVPELEPVGGQLSDATGGQIVLNGLWPLKNIHQSISSVE